MRRFLFASARAFAFTVVVCVAAVSWSGESAQAFSVTRDGFSISNAPGYCFAMAAFSRWYYLRNPDGLPLRRVIGRRNQTCIARELQRFYSRNLVGIQADYCNRYNGNPTESFRQFITGVMMGEPRLVLLMNKTNGKVVLHAVLAYDWSPRDKILKIYDPNYCNSERYLDLERHEYTSLGITYDSICFPEVLNDHTYLVRKMEGLWDRYVARRTASPNREMRVSVRQ